MSENNNFDDEAKKQAEEEKNLKEVKGCFFGFLVFTAVITTASGIYKALNPPKMITISTCSQAKEYLKEALDARDAITPEEAMTPEGRAKWTELRDTGIEARHIKERQCGG